MQLVLAQLPVPVHIELIEYLLQQELLVGPIHHLDQLESHDLYGLLYFLLPHLDFWLVAVVPLRADELGKSLVAQDVETQVTIEVNELLFGDVAFGGQWH